MKKSPKYLLCAPALLALLAFSGCVSGKDSGSSLPYNPENAPAVVVSLPFPEYVQDTDEAFRARGIAEGMISQNALNAAMMDAKVKLAGKVMTAIDAASESVASTAQEDATIVSMRNWKESAKAQVQQTLTDIRVLGEELRREPADSRYIAYVAIEVNKKALANALSNKAAQTSSDEKAKLRENLEKAFSEK